jgi:DNA-binding NarL/FixJ family response regulator
MKAKTKTKAKLRILCVDDDHQLSAMLDLYTKDGGEIVHLDSVKRLDSAMEKISKEFPDIVIVDLSVPDSDPLAVIQEIAKRFPEIRIILYSNQEDQNLIGAAIDAGACKHVHKEHGVKSLLDAIYEAAD